MEAKIQNLRAINMDCIFLWGRKIVIQNTCKFLETYGNENSKFSDVAKIPQNIKIT